MSPSSLYSQQVLCSSIPLSKNVHSFFSAFCTEENIEQSISYLDQVTCFFFCKEQQHKLCYIIAHIKIMRKTPVRHKYVVAYWSRTHIRLVENLSDHLFRYKVTAFVWSRLTSCHLKGSSTGSLTLFYCQRNAGSFV